MQDEEKAKGQPLGSPWRIYLLIKEEGSAVSISIQRFW